MAYKKLKYQSMKLTRRHFVKSACLCAAGMTVSMMFWPRWVSASVALPQDFAGELERLDLMFYVNAFRDFTVARVLTNPHFEYSFAVKHSHLPLEARYATRQIAPGPQINPEYHAEGISWTSIANMCRQERGEPLMGKPKVFDPGSVRQEFGADWGETTMIKTAPTFSKYPKGLVTIIYLQKKHAFAYMIYLFNEASEEIMQAIGNIYYAMQFRR